MYVCTCVRVCVCVWARARAFGLRPRSKTRRSKTRVLGRKISSVKPQERLRFRDLRGGTLAFKNRMGINSCDLEASLSGSEGQVTRLQDD